MADFPQVILAGVPFLFQMKASNNPTSWGADALPPGVTLDTTTGMISGMILTPGVYAFQLTAANSAGSSAPMFVYLDVSPNPSPAIPPIAVPWLTDPLIVTDVQFDLKSRLVTSTCAPLAFIEGDALILGLLLFTPAGQVNDATTIYLTGRQAVDQQPALLDMTIDGATALTTVSGGEYYSIPIDLVSPGLLIQALADLPEPPSTGSGPPMPGVLTLNCQFAVLRSGAVKRSQPFVLTISQRIANAGLAPIYAD